MKHGVFRKQRNILRKIKKQYSRQLNTKSICNRRIFWKTVQPYFSDKGNKSPKITLIESITIVSDENIAELMNKDLINTTKNINWKP